MDIKESLTKIATLLRSLSYEDIETEDTFITDNKINSLHKTASNVKKVPIVDFSDIKKLIKHR